MTTPDPLDTASWSIMDSLTFKPGDRAVWLADAKAIRDKALADLNAEIDSLYRQLVDTSLAIAKHLPTGDDKTESAAAAIKAVYEHGFAQGAAHAADQIAEAVWPGGGELDPVEHVEPRGEVQP